MADSDTPSVDDVDRAARFLAGRLVRTPTLPSPDLSEACGAPAHLKAELLQRTGSFKPRGVLHRLAALTAEERRRGVATVSAGNHAQALAYGCAELGVDCVVIMWRGASALKTAGARALGATVDLDATDPTDAFARLDRLVEDTGRTVIHPFDDLQIAAGQGTVALELLHDVPDADVVVVPVGGGGLLAGMATALAARRPGCRVVAVEPETSTALGSALHAGESVPVAPRSIADGLNAPFAGRIALTVAQRLGVEHVTVTEEEIREGMRFLYGRAKLACEPAGAAATAALQVGKVDVGGASAVVAVVSGGNVDPEVASAILATR